MFAYNQSPAPTPSSTQEAFAFFPQKFHYYSSTLRSVCSLYKN